MNTQKILANAVVLAGFIAIPFIPFIILSNSTFFPYIVGKNFGFRIVVEIMFALYIVLAIVDPVYRPRKSYLMAALGVFLGIITLAAIFGENPAKSFWSNFERMEGVVTYFHLFAYFLIASTVLTVRNMWRPYLNLHLVAGAIMALYAVLQWAGQVEIVQDGMRVNGTLGNAAYLGTYALFNVFIAAFFLVRESFTTFGEKFRVVIYSSLIILQVFVLYHTATRGAMLGLIVGALIVTILIALFEKKRTILRKTAIGALVAIVLSVASFIAVRDEQFIKDSPVLSRFAAISLTEQTTKSRFMIWNMAVDGFKERPALGWGMENFNYVFNKYYDPKMYGQEQWFDRAHNVFFDWLIAGGLPALLAYLSLFGFALYYIWRRGKSLSLAEKSVLTGLLGGYFFQNLFVFDNIVSLIYFFTILAYVESVRDKAGARDKKLKKPREFTDGQAYMITAGAFMLAITLVYVVNHKGYAQNTTLIRALSERSADGAVHNLDLFKEALSYNSYGTAEVREQLAQISMGGLDPAKGISDIQKEFIDLASSELRKQTEITPDDARYQLFMGSFLNRVGQTDEALGYLNRAHELSPTKQAILFELASVHYNKKDLKKTEEYFKQAYELAPEYAIARNYYIQILMENKNFGELAQVLKAYAELSPEDPDAHIKLAALYASMGGRAQAVDELRKAIELSPSFKEQGEYYIGEIQAGRNP